MGIAELYWNRSENALCGLCEFLCVLCVKSFKRKGRKDSRKGRKELKNDQFVPVYGICGLRCRFFGGADSLVD